MRSIYFITLIFVAVLFYFTDNHRISDPIYLVNKAYFSKSQHNLTKPSNEDIRALDDIIAERNIGIRDKETQTYILDSILENRLTDSIKDLAALSSKEYLQKSKKDSLVILNSGSELAFFDEFLKAEYKGNLSEELQQFSDTEGYDVELYFLEEEFPLKSFLDKFQKTNTIYFTKEGEYETGIKVEKWDEYYSFDELFYGRTTAWNEHTVPENILFPYSKYNIYVVALFILVLLMPIFIKAKKILFPDTERKYKNSQRTTALVWIILTILSIFSIISVPIYEIDMSDGGGAMIFLGIFVGLISLLMSFLYTGRAATYDRIYNKETNLAHWEYDERTWNNFIGNDEKERVSGNIKIVAWVSIISAIIVTILALNVERDGEIIIYIGLGIISLLLFAGIIIPKMQARKLKNSKAQCFISHEGLILGSQFHSFTSGGNRFEGAGIENEEQDLLLIVYSYKAKNGRYDYNVNIPIPSGQMEKAKKVVDDLVNFYEKKKNQ